MQGTSGAIRKTEPNILHRYNTRRRKQIMESDHEACIERLELMVKESQDQMLHQQSEMQTQMARLMELMIAFMREKGQASTAETRNDSPNVEGPPAKNSEHAQGETRQEQRPIPTPAAQAPPVIYLNPIAAGQFILGTRGMNAGVSSADPITLDHEEPEKTEGQ